MERPERPLNSISKAIALPIGIFLGARVLHFSPVSLARAKIWLLFKVYIYVYIIDQARGQYPAILTELAWSIKDSLYGIKSTEKNVRDHLENCETIQSP